MGHDLRGCNCVEPLATTGAVEPLATTGAVEPLATTGEGPEDEDESASRLPPPVA